MRSLLRHRSSGRGCPAQTFTDPVLEQQINEHLLLLNVSHLLAREVRMDLAHKGRLRDLRQDVLFDIVRAYVALLYNTAVPLLEEIKDGKVGTKQVACCVIPSSLLLLFICFLGVFKDFEG